MTISTDFKIEIPEFVYEEHESIQVDNHDHGANSRYLKITLDETGFAKDTLIPPEWINS